MDLDIDEFEQLSKAATPSRLVIWAGAGISLDAPTLLPLGFGLTEFALEATCGTATSKHLYALWGSANEICSEQARTQPFSWRPRLESVLGGLGELERDARVPLLAFLPGFTSFAAAPPNAVHFAIGSLLLRGATVFTANFDLCLQQAVRSLTGQDDPFDVDVTGSIRRYRLKPGLAGGEIVHFHGAADDPEYLGATLSRIKEGLPEPFSVLEDRLSSGVLLMMVGYSASDSFDVNPYFMRQPPRGWPASTLIYVKHEGRAAPLHLPALAVGFGRWGEVSAHTGLLMAALAGTCSVEEKPPFEWQSEFSARLGAPPGDAQQALQACAVANALGISVDALDDRAYERAEAENPGYDHQRYHHLLAIAGRERGRPDKEQEHHLRAGSSPRELLGYDYARGDLRSAREKAMSIEEILRMAETVDVLPWAPYTSMSALARPLVSVHAKYPWTRPRGKELDEINSVLHVADVLGSRSTRAVQFVRQIPTAWRFRLLLSALTGSASRPDLEERILDLYAELADLAGFVSSYRDFALVRLLRVRYAPWSARPRLVCEAGRLARRSYRLARLIRDRSGERRARQLALLVAAYGASWPIFPRRTPLSPLVGAP